MKEKFDKFFDHLPRLLGLAIIIDLTCKEIGLQEFSERFFANQTQFALIMQIYNKLFEEYMAAASVNIPIHITLAVLSRGGRFKCFFSNKK